MTTSRRRNDVDRNREFYDRQTTLGSPSLISFRARSRAMAAREVEREKKVIANLWHMVVHTPLDNTKEILSELNVHILHAMKLYDFYNAILNLSIIMEDPSVYSLEWFRLILSFSDAATVLKIAPASQGIKTTIKKYGERKLTISPSLELGASFEHETTSEDKTEVEGGIESKSIKFTAGPKFGITGSYDHKKGWEVEYPKVIDNIRGVMHGKRQIIWEIYCDPAIELPGGVLGKAVNAKTAVTVMVRKDRIAVANVKTRGKAKQKVRFRFDREAPIDFVGPDSIPVKPDFLSGDASA